MPDTAGSETGGPVRAWPLYPEYNRPTLGFWFRSDIPNIDTARWSVRLQCVVVRGKIRGVQCRVHYGPPDGVYSEGSLVWEEELPADSDAARAARGCLENWTPPAILADALEERWDLYRCPPEALAVLRRDDLWRG